jgi:hypothetical protein
MPVHESTTGTDGGFTFETVSPGDYGVRLADAPRGQQPEWFTVRDGETTHRTLEAPRGVAVVGLVKTASGQPVAGATVKYGVLDGFMNVAPEVRFPAGKATTDAQGRFQMDGVEEVAQNAGFSVTLGDGTTWSFRSKPGTELAIPDGTGATVRTSVGDDAAAPLSGATITLERQGDGLVLRRESSTDEAGLASFERVPPGSYLVGASAPGRARASALVTVTGDVTAPRLVLGKGGSLLLEVQGDAPGDVFLVVKPAREPGVPEDSGDVHQVLAAPGKPIRVSGLRVGVLYEVATPGQMPGGVAIAPTQVRCEGDAQTPVPVRITGR